jgi:hypothetical protein
MGLRVLKKDVCISRLIKAEPGGYPPLQRKNIEEIA